MAKFQARHYVAIASVLASNNDNPSLVNDFCNLFAADNPLFDKSRFVEAAKSHIEVSHVDQVRGEFK